MNKDDWKASVEVQVTRTEWSGKKKDRPNSITQRKYCFSGKTLRSMLRPMYICSVFTWRHAMF